MSSIYKLSISGIRSFSDESQETIQFGKPLTLIVGTNGSGKTTIIECLRFATTGELPPNTRNGASFINDPSLHAANATKAQIKLAFQNLNHVSMILSKSIMASRNLKSHNVSFQTRENQLMAIHHGERQTVSSKVADIEQLVPAQLGVSKAVLTYVIFCHQDDSLWPISDSATLKKRFDEIFDSVKFIKALEEMKNSTKALNIEIKVLTNDVAHLKNDKVRAGQKRQSVESLKAQSSRLTGKMNEVQRLIEADDVQLEQLYKTKQDYERTLSRLDSMKQQQADLERHIDRLRSTVKLLNEPRDQLQAKLDDFANFMAQKHKQAEAIQLQMTQETGSISALREKQQANTYKRGKLESLYEVYQKNKSLLDDLDCCTKSDFIELEHKFSDGSLKLKELQDDSTFELSTIKEEIAKEQQHSEYLEIDLKQTGTNKAEMQSTLASMHDNSIRLDAAKTELNAKEHRIEQLKSQGSIDAISSKIDEAKDSEQANERLLEVIRKKMGLSRQNEEMQSKKRILVELNDKAARNIDATTKKLANTVTCSPSEYSSAVNDASKEVAGLRKKLEQLKLRQAELKSNSGKEQLRLDKIEAKRLNIRITRVAAQYEVSYSEKLDIDHFADALGEVEDDYDIDFATIKNYEAYVAFNNRALEIAREKNACSLCHREFHNHEKSNFLELLDKQNKKLSDSTEATKLLKQKETLLKSMRDVAKDVSKADDLKASIPLQEKDVAAKEKESNQVAQDISERSKQFDAALRKESQLQSVSGDISNIIQMQNDVQEREEQIKNIDEASNGPVYSYEDLEKEEKSLRKKQTEIKLQINDLMDQKDLEANRWTVLVNSKNDLQLKVKTLEIESLEKVNLEKSLKEAEEQLSSLSSALDESKSKQSKLQASYDKNNDKYTKQIAKLKKKLDALEVEVNDKKKARDEHDRLTKEIDQYETEDAPQLQLCQELSDQYKSGIDELVPKVEALEAKHSTLEKEIANASGEERNILDNVELISLEQQLIDLKEDISQLDVEKAEAEREEFVLQSKKLQDEQTEHRRQYATMVGENTQLQRQIDELGREMVRDYSDVDSKYAEQYAKLQTKLALVADLGTCYKATDEGIMKFHQQKMEEINRIIDEIWKRTYTGNDLESIVIKADPVAAKTRTTGNIRAHRSYNYRVVMVKNGVELDMRGRCSAGQRVLASIIIRLALSECFGLNFGMIALDEPTTNLDEENIESLAKALSSIIQLRSVQRNFQLIVITHDEKFLRYMDASQFTDHYYRVSRNERLYSTINKVRIAALE